MEDRIQVPVQHPGVFMTLHSRLMVQDLVAMIKKMAVSPEKCAVVPMSTIVPR